jgi:HD-GYP domain-containing protein (c-di-GMP phosphodiesterase class II)
VERFLLLPPLIVLLARFAYERRVGLENALQLSSAYRGTTTLLADVIEHDDNYTGSHSRGVVSLSLEVGEKMGLDAAQLRHVEFAALLHDVGKLAISKDIINKKGPLSKEEWALMKVHTITGEEMLGKVGGLFADVAKIVRSSHERWDGDGYPDGLKGVAIPLEARIVSCCDAFNAMTTDRAYRPAMSVDAALDEVRHCAGTQFDPGVALTLIEVVMSEEAEHPSPAARELAELSLAITPATQP